MGIDRLSLSFLLDDYERDPSAWWTVTTTGKGTERASTSRRQHVSIGKATVMMTEIPTAAAGPLWGKVEFNPSRVVDPEGVGLCSVEDLPGVVNEVMSFTTDLLAPAGHVRDFNVKRIDVTRDFEVSRPSYFVRGLEQIRRPWARHQFTYNDPQRGNAETFCVGGRTDTVRLYDKSEESPEKVTTPTLRWEAECRSWLERYGGIKHLSDISREAIDGLAANRWEWSAMGSSIGARDIVVERVMRSGLSPARQQRLLGILLMRASGVESVMGKNQATSYERLVRSLGLSLAPEALATDDEAMTAHLDFASGQEVVNVA